MSTQIVRALVEHAWLAPLIPVTWLVLKLTRTAALIFSALRDRVLRRNGVSHDERCKLITDAARRDLKSS